MNNLKRNNTSMEMINMDILTNIFLRLPVKCLLRLKSVCKSWHSLITSLYFANLHLQHGFLPSERMLIFVGVDQFLYSVGLDSTQSAAVRLPVTSTWERFSRKHIVGSCNGLLLCICDESMESEALLINPCALFRKRVPKLQEPQNCLYLSYGFGYDCGVDDYKIVKIMHFLRRVRTVGHIFNEVMDVMVGVYSVNSDSWKRVELTVPLFGKLSRYGALVNNHLLHWLCPENKHQILCFDVCNEQWKEMPLPDFTRWDSADDYTEYDYEYDSEFGFSDPSFSQMSIGVLDGSLCLMALNNVWVMKEYGVAESWLQLFYLFDLHAIGSLQCTIPVAYSREGDEILLRKDLLPVTFWYDFAAERTRPAEFLGLPDYHQVSVCIQSLIPLRNRINPVLRI